MVGFVECVVWRFMGKPELLEWRCPWTTEQWFGKQSMAGWRYNPVGHHTTNYSNNLNGKHNYAYNNEHNNYEDYINCHVQHNHRNNSNNQHGHHVHNNNARLRGWPALHAEHKQLL